MKKIVTVKFKHSDKPVYCSSNKLSFQTGMYLICKTNNGMECGKVINPTIKEENVPIDQTVHTIVRPATRKDMSICKDRDLEEKNALPFVEKAILKNNLNMKLISIYKTFDGNKMIFSFSSDDRVDFRELVKSLAGYFHKKIELRQIGVRDQTRILGGLGICGQRLCCSRFLSNFNPVSMKMAKEQGITLSPSKLSGCCSRLMCCLKYEQDAYKELLKGSPVVGSKVTTPDGDGLILDGNPLTGIYRIKLDSNPDAAPKNYSKDKLKFDPTYVPEKISKKDKPPRPYHKKRNDKINRNRDTISNKVYKKNTKNR